MVAAKEPLPCGVKMSFTSYSSLRKGSTGPQVAALQCLLKQLGLKKSISSAYGAGTVTGVNTFRKMIGWSQTGTVTSGVWTALLSSGSKPRG